MTGSSHVAPVTWTSTSPTSTAADVAASVRRCAASPSSAGESVSRARRASTVETTTLASTENAITPMPMPSECTSLPDRQPPHRLEHDHAGADEDQQRLDRGREVLDLVVAVGVVGVGGLVGRAHRDVGDDRRDQVDRRVHRLGDDRDRAGDRAGRDLQHDEDRVRGDRQRRGARLDRPADVRGQQGAGHQVLSSSSASSSRAARPRWLIASFSRGIELGHRAPAGQVVGQEGGVVAEAAVAARHGGERAGAAALDGVDDLGAGGRAPGRASARARASAITARLRQHERADVRQRRAGRRLAQQLVEVLLVGRVLAGEARGAHAGGAAERRGLDARVVGDRRQAGRARGGERLVARVVEERLAGLGRQLDVVGQRDDLVRGQQRRELARLVGVAGREDELHTATAPS